MLTPQEQESYNRIKIWSDNDPLNPEFPPADPKFPATPTYQIQVQGFTNVRLKDESHNLTWTHKDRMAREIVVSYKHILEAKKNASNIIQLPHMSIISSWSAAIAIQTLLREYNLPALKVLMSHLTQKQYIEKLEELGAEIYQTDLEKEMLWSAEILERTNNKTWIDITSSTALDPTQTYYDWLWYEVVNSSPGYCFIPFGTWHLYENILNVNKKVISSKEKDPRFSWDVEKLRNCHFLWATTNNPRTSAQKLYSPHLPFVNFSEQWIKFYKLSGFCGKESRVQAVQEKYLMQASELAREQWIQAEPSWIAWLALLLQTKNTIPKDAKILIVNTGKTKNV